MNAFNTDTAACEATRQLAKAAHELHIQRGNGIIDLPKLERLLTIDPEHHAEHLADVIPIRPGIVVKTASAPLNLDPHETYYRPPFIGRAHEVEAA